MKRKHSDEFQNFDKAMTQLLKVSHEEIKEKLAAEKAAKPAPSRIRARKTAKKNSAIGSGNEG